MKFDLDFILTWSFWFKAKAKWVEVVRSSGDHINAPYNPAHPNINISELFYEQQTNCMQTILSSAKSVFSLCRPSARMFSCRWETDEKQICTWSVKSAESASSLIYQFESTSLRPDNFIIFPEGVFQRQYNQRHLWNYHTYTKTLQYTCCTQTDNQFTTTTY